MVANSPLGPGSDLGKCGTCQQLKKISTMKVEHGRYKCADCQTCKPYQEKNALGAMVTRNPCKP